MPQQNLTGARLEDVPPGVLYQLQKEFSIGGEKTADEGKQLLVSPHEIIPVEVARIVDTLRRSPEAAFAMLKVRGGVTAIIRMAQDIHEGSGMTVTAEEDTPTSLRFRGSLVPSPITAEHVSPTLLKTSQIPKERTIVLAKSYYLTSTDRGTVLTEIDDDQIPESANPMTEGMFARRGTYFVLTEESGKLIMQMWGNKKGSFEVADCELEVSIPSDKVEEGYVQ